MMIMILIKMVLNDLDATSAMTQLLLRIQLEIELLISNVLLLDQQCAHFHLRSQLSFWLRCLIILYDKGQWLMKRLINVILQLLDLFLIKFEVI